MITDDAKREQQVDNMIKNLSTRHLGLYMNLDGSTEESQRVCYDKVFARIRQLKLHNMKSTTLKLTINMLVNSMHSYAPLQVGYDPATLLQWDKQLLRYSRKGAGFSTTDAPHFLFLHPSHLGLGARSFLETDLKATARELEIALNGSEMDSDILRTRWAAIHSRLSETLHTPNHIYKAVSKLAQFGFYLRDSQDGFINVLLDIIALDKGLHPLGTPKYKGTNHTLLGCGVKNNAQVAMGSEWYHCLQDFRFNRVDFHTVAKCLHYRGDRGTRHLRQLVSRCIAEIHHNNNQGLGFFEWKYASHSNPRNHWNDWTHWKEIKLEAVQSWRGLGRFRELMSSDIGK